MKQLTWSSLSAADRQAALARPPARRSPELVAGVGNIVEEVRAGGWDALVRLSTRIDGAAPSRVAVAPLAAAARTGLPPETVAAMELAAANVARFHAASLPADTRVETMPGLMVEKVWRPLDRVGLYVPGGATPLFSTLLMLALPARAAGVEEIVVVTPPSPGGLAPALALAADLCGITHVWTVGGAQAIAALAFGAGEIPACPKICGPGNAWVAEAKSLVSALPGGPAIDMPAGPSELMVIADSSADPATVAADLLSQAEHDASAQVLLVSDDAAMAETVAAEVERQVATLPRAELARASLAHGRVILAEDLAQAAAIANAYAPEHLCLAVADPAALLPLLRNAGAIFAGHAAAESFGDYLAGSSHVLPTDGAARAWSGITTVSFMKAISIQHVSAEAGRALAAPAAALARLEALEAHARAADARAAR
ncbi:histidinol dehydrogenase [Sphingomonas astaxanthinifaciens]|uniref:Histidinol dehydrogenase n=1 Tax=Sphingomonas astaxanthinifaciens DSM 22298 TaxID=1123267 RepID=A0ABQ5Z8L6_9SPHN|nr:histidinol dehydrogenase [Sphingomonas astaxanthinifaciens]GLR47975.1 histidinol dehydrogenase [Sphingomonas astaxanthinifaciens DSM 22298]